MVPAKSIIHSFFSMGRRITNYFNMHYHVSSCVCVNRRFVIRSVGAMSLLRAKIQAKIRARDRFIEPISRESVRHRMARRYQRQLPATCVHEPLLLVPLTSPAIPSVALIFLVHPATRMAIFNVSPRSSLKTPPWPGNERTGDPRKCFFFYHDSSREFREFSRMMR